MIMSLSERALSLLKPEPRTHTAETRIPSELVECRLHDVVRQRAVVYRAIKPHEGRFVIPKAGGDGRERERPPVAAVVASEQPITDLAGFAGLSGLREHEA